MGRRELRRGGGKERKRRGREATMQGTNRRDRTKIRGSGFLLGDGIGGGSKALERAAGERESQQSMPSVHRTACRVSSPPPSPHVPRLGCAVARAESGEGLGLEEAAAVDAGRVDWLVLCRINPSLSPVALPPSAPPAAVSIHEWRRLQLRGASTTRMRRKSKGVVRVGLVFDDATLGLPPLNAPRSQSRWPLK